MIYDCICYKRLKGKGNWLTVWAPTPLYVLGDRLRGMQVRPVWAPPLGSILPAWHDHNACHSTFGLTACQQFWPSGPIVVWYDVLSHCRANKEKMRALKCWKVYCKLNVECYMTLPFDVCFDMKSSYVVVSCIHPTWNDTYVLFVMCRVSSLSFMLTPPQICASVDLQVCRIGWYKGSLLLVVVHRKWNNNWAQKT